MWNPYKVVIPQSQKRERKREVVEKWRCAGLGNPAGPLVLPERPCGKAHKSRARSAGLGAKPIRWWARLHNFPFWGRISWLSRGFQMCPRLIHGLHASFRFPWYFQNQGLQIGHEDCGVAQCRTSRESVRIRVAVP